MKKDAIIKSFEILVANAGAKRNKGYQFKIAMYRRAMKAFKDSDKEPKTFNEANKILGTVFKNPEKISAMNIK